jgi:2-polyprenyl-3-methyl-5-hydroxy-6-metoxy-1,4-benzoquinol methylase
MVTDNGLKYKTVINIRDKADARSLAYRYVKTNLTVLDVGCACGDFGSLIHNLKKCKVTGFDYDQKSLEFAAKTMSYVSLHQIDLNNDLKNKLDYLGRKFDCIVLLDVLEHLIKPHETVLILKEYLNEDGYFIISLPNVAFVDVKLDLMRNKFEYTPTGILDETHIRFFTHHSIRRFLDFAGLIVCDVSFNFQLPTFSKINFTSIFSPAFFSAHSYVYQYVFVASPSRSPNHLRALEPSLLSPLISLLPRLFRILAAYLFPGGTRRGKLIRLLIGKKD